MGKSVAVAVAITNLSTMVPVLAVKSKTNDSAEDLLSRLVPVTPYWYERFLHLLPGLSPSAHSIADALSMRSASNVTPIFVVESAELLSVNQSIKSLFKLAKEMADRSSGKFVFVVSPTDKMEEMRHFGSLSRATIVVVEEMTYGETWTFLSGRGCTHDRITATYDLLGGHLAHFASLASNDPVSRLCGGDIGVAEFEKDMLAWLGKSITASMRGTRLDACSVLCAIANNTYGDEPGYNDAVLHLLREHVVRFSLAEKAVILDSPLLAHWMDKNCHCEPPVQGPGGSGYPAQCPGAAADGGPESASDPVPG